MKRPKYPRPVHNPEKLFTLTFNGEDYIVSVRVSPGKEPEKVLEWILNTLKRAAKC